MNAFDKRLIETWYYVETVKGISTINDFIDCEKEIHGKTSFSEWLVKQELKADFKEWLEKRGIDYK